MDSTGIVKQIPSPLAEKWLNASNGKGFDAIVNPLTGAVKQYDFGNDQEAVESWINTKRSPATRRAYAKEIRRFTLFLSASGLNLGFVRAVDIDAYARFLRDPDPNWISATKHRFGSDAWRPFAKPLTDAGIAYAMTIVRSLMDWLTSVGYASSSPIPRNSHLCKAPEKPLAITRYLSTTAIDYMFDAIESMPERTPAQCLEKARSRFLLTLYYGSALRLFEPAAAPMSAIQTDELGTWIYIVGKGNKPARVPVSTPCMEAFRVYRALVRSGDDTPLIVATRGKSRRATDEAIANAIEKVMRAAAKRAQENGDEGNAKALSAATTHWLRHSRISHLVNAGENLQLVRALARHQHLNTTGLYSHSEELALQELVKRS